MIDIFLYTISFLGGFIIGSHLIAYYFSRKQFVIKMDKNNNPVIESVNKSKGGLEFIQEPTQQELEENERESSLSGFLKSFRKPKKEEDDDDEF